MLKCWNYRAAGEGAWTKKMRQQHCTHHPPPMSKGCHRPGEVNQNTVEGNEAPKGMSALRTQSNIQSTGSPGSQVVVQFPPMGTMRVLRVCCAEVGALSAGVKRGRPLLPRWWVARLQPVQVLITIVKGMETVRRHFPGLPALVATGTVLVRLSMLYPQGLSFYSLLLYRGRDMLIPESFVSPGDWKRNIPGESGIIILHSYGWTIHWKI